MEEDKEIPRPLIGGVGINDYLWLKPDDPVERHYGRHIRNFRWALGLTQEKLSKLTGVGRTVITKMEGKELPSIVMMNRILNPLGWKANIVFTPIDQEEINDERIINLLVREKR